MLLTNLDDGTISTKPEIVESDLYLIIPLLKELGLEVTTSKFSSTIGILGSLYQIIPRSISQNTSRLHNLSSTRGRHIIIWLAIADLFASLGVLIRSSLWLQYKSIMPMPNDDVSVLFCSIISAWTQYFYTATWFWTLFYAIDTWHSIKGIDSRPVLYHSLAWGIPAATTSIGLSILYIPNATCHNISSISTALLRILPNYCVTYLPIAMVMIVNPVIYVLASKKIEMAVALPLAQALLNPMQALLNALVYRKWSPSERRQRSTLLNLQKSFSFHDEQSPLLGSEPPRLPMSPIPPAINNYATM
ncbi:jg9775 [Pararge aegeria aegeria]|uniref:Jg9775 protein n=1 Tax=Pararge aegeria aegeria TaxID=348720 RepID=A0A8S4RMM4_9NEOP|nr:jg9775 [Pararge aegeria aegeria]